MVTFTWSPYVLKYKQSYIRSTVNGVEQVNGRLLLQGFSFVAFFFREK